MATGNGIPPGANARKFLRRTFGVLAAGLLAVAALNFTIDPGSLFQVWKNQSGHLEKEIAAALNDGSNVATGLYFDVPQMKIRRVGLLHGNLDLLVVGSSRGMEIRQKTLGRPGTFFNAFVSSANLQDVLAMYEACTANRPRPSFVLICVDPWIFNAGHPDIEWESLTDSYDAIARRLRLDLPASPSLAGATAWTRGQRIFFQWLDKSKELISWGYTSESLKIIAQRWRGGEALFQPDFSVTKAEFERLRVFRSDGSVAFEAAYRERDPKEVELGAVQYGHPPVFGLGDFSAIDPQRREVFERFVADLQSSGTKVAFFLPPYHPASYAEFLKDDRSRTVVAVEKYLHDYASAHGIPVRGSYDPKAAGCLPNEFHDATHVAAPRVEAILEGILN